MCLCSHVRFTSRGPHEADSSSPLYQSLVLMGPHCGETYPLNPHLSSLFCSPRAPSSGFQWQRWPIKGLFQPTEQPGGTAVQSENLKRLLGARYYTCPLMPEASA